MNAKRKGNKREHRTMRLLEEQGYNCTRAAASLSAFDEVAVSPAAVLLVQVKSNRWPSAAELRTPANFAGPPGCRKLLHRWQERAKAPDLREVV